MRWDPKERTPGVPSQVRRWVPMFWISLYCLRTDSSGSSVVQHTAVNQAMFWQDGNIKSPRWKETLKRTFIRVPSFSCLSRTEIRGLSFLRSLIWLMHKKSEYRCHGNEGTKRFSNHLLYGRAFLPGWSFVSQFGLRLVQCLPWEGEGQISNGEEGRRCGGPQTIILCRHGLFIGSCPEALFKSNTKESKVKYSAVLLIVSKSSCSFPGFVLS